MSPSEQSLPSPPAQLPRRVTLVLDPVTHAELERAAGHQNVDSFLYVLAGRYARWNELREWLSHLETAYGAVPPEALERVHRQMLGMPRRPRDAGCPLTLTFTPDELTALAEAAGSRPLAHVAREVILDHLAAERPAQPVSEPAGAPAAE